jgi:tryptophanyl-tRNA synthetase
LDQVSGKVTYFAVKKGLKMSKKIILSGIQPTGNLNIGTFIGAVKNWVALQEEYSCLYMVVDLHAITVRQDPEQFRNRCLSFVAQYIACGLDPKRCSLFLQSHVHQHTELAWMLGCFTGLGELQRMTQFKEKSEKYAKNLNAGLLTYPILMAADILLYQTDLVPVGEDQKQHLELTRDLAQRLNSHYRKELFKIPKPFIPKLGARIMSLQDPLKKMSKSDEDDKANLWLLDSPKQIEKKLKSSVTDSDTVICYDPASKPGVSNLLTIYCSITGKSFTAAQTEFAQLQYGHLKIETARVVSDFLKPVREHYEELMRDPDNLMDILNEGARTARKLAENTLEQLRDSIGFHPLP